MDKKDIRDLGQLTLYLLVLLICTAGILNILMGLLHLSTASGLGNKEWLGFWGSYLGSGLGAITTLIAFLATYRQNATQHRQAQEQIVDQIRLSVRPILELKTKQFNSLTEAKYYNVLSFKPDGQTEIFPAAFGKNRIDTDDKQMWVALTVSSVGAASAFQIKLLHSSHSFPIGSLESGHSQDLLMTGQTTQEKTDPKDQVAYTTSIPDGSISYLIEFTYYDIVGNQYKQSWWPVLTYSAGKVSFSIPDITFPELIEKAKG